MSSVNRRRFFLFPLCLIYAFFISFPYCPDFNLQYYCWIAIVRANILVLNLRRKLFGLSPVEYDVGHRFFVDVFIKLRKLSLISSFLRVLSQMDIKSYQMIFLPTDMIMWFFFSSLLTCWIMAFQTLNQPCIWE